MVFSVAVTQTPFASCVLRTKTTPWIIASIVFGSAFDGGVCVIVTVIRDGVSDEDIEGINQLWP